MNALRGNSFAVALDIYDDNSGAVNVFRDSADSPERSALDTSLHEVCGISQDEGVRAGLPPHKPLDDALARADFCQGWLVATGNGIPPAWMSVAWVEGLNAPPAIVTQWSALGDFYALHGRSPERTQDGHEVRGYLRINCSNDI